MSALPLILALVVGTWNGEWFPSGRAEHRASDEVERATIAAAGQMIREGLSRVDPSGRDDLVLCFNEIRDAETAEALCRAIGRTNLAVTAVSGYRRRDRFDQQQDVIMTTLPTVRGSWSRWKSRKDSAWPPRGYARVEVVLPSAVTATVYAVHLKSNYGQTTEAESVTNRLRRAYAIDQLIDQERPKRGRARNPVVIAGDFNADRYAADPEPIFKRLEESGFRDPFASVGADGRVTFPGSGRRGGRTYDYIMLRGLDPSDPPVVVPALRLSDHNAVFLRLKF